MSVDMSWTLEKNRLSTEYKNGVKSFIERARNYLNQYGQTRCPCCSCVNGIFQDLDTVRFHLLRHGFQLSYRTWIFHGEKYPMLSSNSTSPTRGHKLKVEFNNQNGRVIGPNASSFANEMEIIVCSMVPLAVKRWKELYRAQKMSMIDRLKEKFEFETTKMIEDSLDQSMNKQWNEYCCKLQKDFKIVDGLEDIGRAKRSKLNSDWDFLHDHFGSDALKRNEATKELLGQSDFFCDMHFSKGKGWTIQEAENYYKKMIDLCISTQNSPLEANQDSLPSMENQICNQVLGKRFSHSEPHKSMSRKMRLEDDTASLENAALRTRVKDLEDEMKNWTYVLSRVPRDILLPVQNDSFMD